METPKSPNHSEVFTNCLLQETIKIAKAAIGIFTLQQPINIQPLIRNRQVKRLPLQSTFQMSCRPTTAISTGKPIPLSTLIILHGFWASRWQVVLTVAGIRSVLVISAPSGFDRIADYLPARPSSFPRRPSNNIRDTPATSAFRAIKLAAFPADGRVRGSAPGPAVGLTCRARSKLPPAVTGWTVGPNYRIYPVTLGRTDTAVVLSPSRRYVAALRPSR